MHDYKFAGWMRRGPLVAIVAMTLITAGCRDGDGGNTQANSGAPRPTLPTRDPGQSANTPPTIAGAPAAKVNVGSSYNMTPAAEDADGDTLAFSVRNRPAWANFNTATGQLTGTPAAEHAGAHENVVVSVSDGKANVSLPAFSITVSPGPAAPVAALGAVSLQWTPPTEEMDDTPLTNLAGYRIHYGTNANALKKTIDVSSAGIVNYVVENLAPGAYFFAVRAITSDGVQSELSNVVRRDVG